MFFCINLVFATSVDTISELAYIDVTATDNETNSEAGARDIKGGENEPDINSGIEGSDFVISNAVIDPSSNGNIETYIVKDNAKIGFYIINSKINPQDVYIQNYYYMPIGNRNAKIRCRDYRYNIFGTYNIAPDKVYGNLKSTDKKSDCLFIYQIDYKISGEEDNKTLTFAYKIVSDDEFVMYQNMEIKPVIEKDGEIKRPKKVTE